MATLYENLLDEYDYLTSDMIREAIEEVRYSENDPFSVLTATQVNDNIKLRVALRAKNEHVKASEDIRGYTKACLLDDKFCSVLRGVSALSDSPLRDSGPRTFAVLIGCDYTGSTKPLGAYRDVARMYSLLCDVYHWPPADILVMTDVEFDDAKYHYHMIPTKANILDAVSRLARMSKSGDNLVFYYSGRGERNDDSELREGAIVACDDRINGRRNIIKADELRLSLWNSLAIGADLLCVFESSHTAQLLGISNYETSSDTPWSTAVERCGRNIMCLIASRDEIPPKRLTSPHGVSYGVFTKTLVENCRQSPRITAVTLLSRLNSTFAKYKCENRAILTWSDTLSKSSLFALFLPNRAIPRPLSVETE